MGARDDERKLTAKGTSSGGGLTSGTRNAGKTVILFSALSGGLETLQRALAEIGLRRCLAFQFASEMWEAVEEMLAREEPPGFFVLDTQDLPLSGIDPRSLIERIRGDARLKNLPVVAVVPTDAYGEELMTNSTTYANCYVMRPVESDPDVHPEGFACFVGALRSAIEFLPVTSAKPLDSALLIESLRGGEAQVVRSIHATAPGRARSRVRERTDTDRSAEDRLSSRTRFRGPSHGTPEVLLIECNPADVRLVRESFKEVKADCNINVVGDGELALTYLRREGEFASAPRPALILMELNLPRLDGRELLAIIKGDPELKKIPVVVLTASQAEMDITKSYDLYANAYVTKPVSLDQFVEVVNSIVKFWLAVARERPETAAPRPPSREK